MAGVNPFAKRDKSATLASAFFNDIAQVHNQIAREETRRVKPKSKRTRMLMRNVRKQRMRERKRKSRITTKIIKSTPAFKKLMALVRDNF